MRRPMLVLLAVTAALAVAGLAVAATTFTAETIPDSGTLAYAPAAGIDGAGNALAAWPDDRDFDRKLAWADRPAGGPWGAAEVEASEIGVRQFSADDVITTEVNGAGAALVVWINHLGDVRSAYRASPGAAWEFEATPIESAVSEYVRAALDEDGDAIVGWYREDQTPTPDEYLVEVSRRPAGGSWGAPEVVESGVEENFASVRLFDVGFTGTGTPAVFWGDERPFPFTGTVSQRDGSGWNVDHAVPLAAGGFSMWQSVGGLGRIEPLPNGLLALWKECDSGDGVAAIRVAALGGSGFGAVHTVDEQSSSGCLGHTDPDVDTNTAGDAMVSYLRQTGDAEIRAARMTAAGAWDTTTTLESVEVTLPEPAVADSGITAVLWRRQSGENRVATADSPTAPWDPHQRVGPARESGVYEPGLASIAARNGMVVAWNVATEDGTRIDAAVLAGTGGGNGSPTPGGPSVTPTPVPTIQALSGTRAICKRRRCKLRLTLAQPAKVKFTVTRGKKRTGRFSRSLPAGKSTVAVKRKMTRKKGRYRFVIAVPGLPNKTLKKRVR